MEPVELLLVLQCPIRLDLVAVDPASPRIGDIEQRLVRRERDAVRKPETRVDDHLFTIRPDQDHLARVGSIPARDGDVDVAIARHHQVVSTESISDRRRLARAVPGKNLLLRAGGRVEPPVGSK